MATTSTISRSSTNPKRRRSSRLKFEPVEGGQQMHAVVTHVIDRRGRFGAKFHGLRFDPVNLVLYVNGLTNAPQRPLPRRGWWDGVRFFLQN